MPTSGVFESWWRWCCFLGTIILMLAALSTCLAQGQTTTAGNQGATWEFKDAPLQEVVEALAKAGDFDYTIASGVSARVTASLHNVSPVEALRIILDSVGLTFSNDQGIYHIKRKAAPRPSADRENVMMSAFRPAPVREVKAVGTHGEAAQPSQKKMVVRKIPIKHVSAADIARIFGGQVIQSGAWWGGTPPYYGGWGGYGARYPYRRHQPGWGGYGIRYPYGTAQGYGYGGPWGW